MHHMKNINCSHFGSKLIEKARAFALCNKILGLVVCNVIQKKMHQILKLAKTFKDESVVMLATRNNVGDATLPVNSINEAVKIMTMQVLAIQYLTCDKQGLRFSEMASF